MGPLVVSPRTRIGGRGAAALAAVLVGCAAVASSQLGVSADSATITPDRQLYATKGPDPYADSELHLAIVSGQLQAWSYLHFNLASLPRGSTLDGLAVTLVPNGNAQQNQNPASTTEVFAACVLDQPIPAQYDPQNPPAYDCNKLRVAAKLQPGGSWRIDLGPMLATWKQTGNSAAALVPLLNYGDVPANPLGASPEDTWTATFDHTRTAAAVEFTPPDVPAPLTYLPPPGPVTLFRTLPPPPAPAPAAPPVVAAPVSPPAPSPAAQPAPPAPAAVVPVVTTQPRLSHAWLVVLLAVAIAAALLLAVAARQQTVRTGALSLAAVGRSLVAARSQMATPLAVLALAAVVSAGYAGQMVTSVQSGSGGPAGAGAQAQRGSGPGTHAQGPGPGGTTSAAQPGTAQPGGDNLPGGAAGGVATGPGALQSRGVTAQTVTIGMEYTTDSNTNNAAFGVTGDVNNFGSPQPQAQAVVDWVNAHGGIAGRRAVIDWQGVSVARSQSDPNYLEEVCKNYTENDHVFAVVNWINSIDNESCYAQEHTLLLDLSPDQADQAYYHQLAPYLWAPDSMATDRAQKTRVDGLARKGFFSGGTLASPYRLGIVYPDEAREDEIYQNITLPRLAKYGISASQVEPFKVRISSIQALAADEQTAVVKFEGDNVNHVSFQGSASGGEGGMALLFIIGAYKQHYHPTYGLGSTDAPSALEQQNQNVMKDQLKGAVAVGWEEGSDVEDANGDPWPPRSGPEKRCMDIEQAGGLAPFATRSDAYQAIAYCDAVLMLWQATRGLTTLTAQTFSERALELGSSFASGNAYSSELGYNHWDAPSGYRLLHEEENCNINGSTQVCFKYDSFTTYAAATIDSGEP